MHELRTTRQNKTKQKSDTKAEKKIIHIVLRLKKIKIKTLKMTLK